MKIVKLVIILVIVLSLCGCSLKKEDNKKCIESHTEPRVLFFPSGNGQLIPVMIPQTVCDKWEE